MRPNTSVRQPVIAGARRHHLSEMLRKWRRQPRKRSPVLFWALLSLAVVCDSGLIALTARLLGIWGPPSTVLHPIHIDGMEGDTEFREASEGSFEAPHSVEGGLFAPILSDRLPALRRALGLEAKASEGPKPTREQWMPAVSPGRQALYWSVLTAGLFAAATSVRRFSEHWRRVIWFAGLMTCLACLGWSSWVLLGPAVRTGAAIVGNGSQGAFWFAAMGMGLGLALGLVYRNAFFSLAGALISSIGFAVANRWPLPFLESVPNLPGGDAGDSWLQVQVMLLLSAYAALALAWCLSAITLAQIIPAAPSSERLSRPAALSLLPVCLGMALLGASALLDGWRALQQGPPWQACNMQMLGTIVVLPGCAALVYARRWGRMPPFRFLTSITLGFAFLAMMCHGAWRARSWDVHQHLSFDVDAGPYVAGLLSLSLAGHAALSYYFGRQRTVEL